MSDPESRAFRRRLTAVLLVLGAVTAGAVFLFGHLLFRSLSRDVYNEALLHSRIDAERIARGVTEKSQGDLFTLKAMQREIDTLVGSAVRERRVLSNVSVLDRKGNVVYRYKSELERREPVPAGSPEGVQIPSGEVLVPPERVQELTTPIADPYDIEIPLGDVFVLHVGLSRKELEKRVEKLRNELYLKTAAAAAASLLGIGAASAAVILLYRRTRKIEAAHREAERRAELGELAAGLAHEIRNPLNAMGLNLEILEEELRKTPAVAAAAQTRELAQAARVETGRLNRLLTDFLAYARPAPIHPLASDLNEIAGEALAFLGPEARGRRIRLDFRPHPGGAPAALDAARVRQVVLNLVANALDAVEAEGAAAREVTVSVEADGGRWKLTVADHGPGVPQSTLPDVFRAFVSTKAAGTGLGLPIAERIVKAHGGTLTLSSDDGEPTRAVATFPMAT